MRFIWCDYDPETMGYLESFAIQTGEAVIFPDNVASQKAFARAGFRHHHSYEDGTAMYFVYNRPEEEAACCT